MGRYWHDVRYASCFRAIRTVVAVLAVRYKVNVLPVSTILLSVITVKVLGDEHKFLEN